MVFSHLHLTPGLLTKNLCSCDQSGLNGDNDGDHNADGGDGDDDVIGDDDDDCDLPVVGKH